MNSQHISALSFSLFIYALQALSFFGWGKGIVRLLALQRQESTHITLFIWMGWAVSLLLFQGLNLFLPLTAFVVIPFLLIGVGLAVPHIVSVYRRVTLPPSRLTLLVLLGVIIVAITFSCWVASRSMLPPNDYDSGLYHFNKIRWINSFPTVPGLGNLHGRLAFNQSFFTYVGAFNFYPFFGHGRSIANSFLLLLTMATFIDLLYPVFKRPAFLIESHIFRYTPAIILFPALGFLTFFTDGLSSPSPDLTSALLQLTIFVVFSQVLGERLQEQTVHNYKILFLGTLATTAVTIKLSNLAFSATIIGLLLLYVKAPLTRRAVIHTMTLSTFIILIWCLQGILLSGVPLFPSTLGHLPVDWAVPIEKITDEANKVYGWARQPRTHWSNVLGNWDWCGPWVSRLFDRYFAQAVFPLIMSVILLIVTLAMKLVNKVNQPKPLEWSVLLPAILGLTFWFFTAPDIRFANGIFFILAVCSALLFLSAIQTVSTTRTFVLILFLVFLVTNYKIVSLLVANRGTVKYVSFTGWQPARKNVMVQKTTLSGLSIYIPKITNQCWDSPLPSAPSLDKNLRLRDSNDMSSGFTVTRKAD